MGNVARQQSSDGQVANDFRAPLDNSGDGWPATITMAGQRRGNSGGFSIFYGNPYDRNSIQTQPERAGLDNVFNRRAGLTTDLPDGLAPGVLDDI